jgi:hypothetical protein
MKPEFVPDEQKIDGNSKPFELTINKLKHNKIHTWFFPTRDDLPFESYKE